MARAPNAAENGGENFVHHIVADPKNVMVRYGSEEDERYWCD